MIPVRIYTTPHTIATITGLWYGIGHVIYGLPESLPAIVAETCENFLDTGPCDPSNVQVSCHKFGPDDQNYPDLEFRFDFSTIGPTLANVAQRENAIRWLTKGIGEWFTQAHLMLPKSMYVTVYWDVTIRNATQDILDDRITNTNNPRVSTR